jgi:thiamine pyrophosphokinase
LKAVIVADGAHAPSDQDVLAGADVVIAADGGANWLATTGRSPDQVVGDFDSVSPDLVAEFERAGIILDRHPTNKDASDLELSLVAAIATGADELVILGALGGELDHLAANLLLLGSDLAAGRRTSLVHDRTTARLLPGPSRLEIEAPAETRVSLLALGGPAEGVSTRGLQWALDGDRLDPGSSRGLANVVTESPAAVALDSGHLLVIEIEPPEEAPS